MYQEQSPLDHSAEAYSLTMGQKISNEVFYRIWDLPEKQDEIDHVYVEHPVYYQLRYAGQNPFDDPINMNNVFFSQQAETRRLLQSELEKVFTEQSIADFINLQKDFLEELHRLYVHPEENHHVLTREPERFDFRKSNLLELVLLKLGVFADAQKLAAIKHKQPLEVWRSLHGERNIYRRISEKKCQSVDNLIERLDQEDDQAGFQVTRGLVIGDFALGPHTEQIELFEQMREALGNSGVLTIAVASKISILATTDKTRILDDDERLNRVAALEAVDLAVITDPPPKYYGNVNLWYRDFWEKVRPNICGFGAKDYFLVKELRERSMRYGGILLYRGDESIHNQQLIDALLSL